MKLRGEYRPLDNLIRHTLLSITPCRKITLTRENIRVIAYSPDPYHKAFHQRLMRELWKGRE